ncbi:cytochrome C [Geobacillus genomosp. 3]|uniref:Cytochrome C n=1 Tax=Geobacillus genomosp. 3 TaxID=1921421 RepID=S6A2B0_GEOG3|nr:c-type cytochrome [Geobacillus genomosp. 3]AGT32171.1 cytochrome C [Geobacillus genomosp. 3]
MKQTVIIFLVSALIGLAGGYVYFQPGEKGGTNAAQTAKQETESVSEPSASAGKEGAKGETANASTQDGNILQKKGCLSCHSVSKLNLQGGTTGPDLSNAYQVVEGKHGKPIEEFLKAPTSAVMSGVIKSNPLTDEERADIIALLKEASEK